MNTCFMSLMQNLNDKTIFYKKFINVNTVAGLIQIFEYIKIKRLRIDYANCCMSITLTKYFSLWRLWTEPQNNIDLYGSRACMQLLTNCIKGTWFYINIVLSSNMVLLKNQIKNTINLQLKSIFFSFIKV